MSISHKVLCCDLAISLPSYKKNKAERADRNFIIVLLLQRIQENMSIPSECHSYQEESLLMDYRGQTAM